ncbi:MAG: hypothetical protein FD143_947 [Ignavibacteria bacterium]|nr:MAG: hypothetical protein FD143_947 [Ignavibacteria bacterium]KAF0161190.1 MAG: hypothetical protein FD188_1101 [Ignavibacteria bacterium]
MKFFLPDNIFAALFKSTLPADFETVYKPSTLIVKELEKNTQAIALIPSLELLNNKDLLVSKKFGISFGGILSNSYLYFVEGQRDFDKVFVRGDVSKNEILLSKILFEEMYSSNAELVLDTSDNLSKWNNYLICGKENFVDQKHISGVSLADEIFEMLGHPYVNYIVVSKDRESLSNFERSIPTKLREVIAEYLPKFMNELNISDLEKEFLTANFGTVYFDMTENEEDGLNELIKLMYYHGIIDDMFDIKLLK